MFLSFPPFYSLSMIGGHNFKPFHFLGERFAVFITNLYTGGNVRDYATCYGEFGLYPLTIGQVKELILTSEFILRDTYCRLSPINTGQHTVVAHRRRKLRHALLPELVLRLLERGGGDSMVPEQLTAVAHDEGLLICQGAKVSPGSDGINGDVPHAFRPSSPFHYLTGFDEPDSVLVATRTSAREHRAILFLRPREPERELWDGPRLGPRRAVTKLGFDEAYPMASLYERLEELLGETKRLFYTLGADGLMDRSLERVFERLAVRAHRGNPSAHPVIEDPGPAIATERLVKDRHEIRALERAATISAAGHRRAMPSCAARPWSRSW